MKRVLLIQPQEKNGVRWAFYPPSGLLSLATVLSHEGYMVELIDVLAEGMTDADIQKRLRDFQPECVGISINTMLLDHAVELAQLSREVLPDSVIVAGGPHVTCVKEEIFRDIPCLDAAFIGEAEETFPLFLRSGQQEKVHGVIWKGEKFAGDVPYIDDIEQLPTPDFMLVRLDRYYGFQRQAKKPTAYINCSRGCYYNCYFCSNPVRKRPVRFRSIQSVINELLSLKTKHNVQEVFFMDDMLNSNLIWAEQIFHAIIEHGLNRQMRFVMQFRANEKITPPWLFELAARAGVYCVIFGVESGSQKILDRTNKKLKVAEIERAFDLASKSGLITVASLILGLPGEDEGSIAETVRLVQKIRPSVTGLGFATPLPSTELREQYLKEGGLLQEDYRNYSFCRCIVRTKSLTRQQLTEKYQVLFKAFSLQHIVD